MVKQFFFSIFPYNFFARFNLFISFRCAFCMAFARGKRKKKWRSEIAYVAWGVRVEFNEPFSCWLYYKKCNPILKMKKCYQQYVVTNIECIIYRQKKRTNFLWQWRVSETFHFIPHTLYPLPLPHIHDIMSRYKCTCILMAFKKYLGSLMFRCSRFYWINWHKCISCMAANSSFISQTYRTFFITVQ